ncbi:sensor histidine kinase [Paenibacillus sp. 1P07SE]|uniref:sensor histidine kinase n=1 Tax=Paenibacillus sp. 1P07SE TaxID=3132209 RepID=UPI0039A72F84
MIYIQVLLDSVIMLLLCYALSGQPIRLEKSVVAWFFSFHGFCILLRLDVTHARSLFEMFNINNFDILPVNNPVFLLLMVCGLLILNSAWIRPASNMKTIVVTLLSFLIWILLRTFSISAAGLVLGDSASALFPYLHRTLTLLLAAGLYYLLLFKRGSGFLDDFSGLFSRVMLIQSSLAVLAIIVFSNFDTAFVLENLLFILIVFSLVISMNLWIIYEHNTRSRREKRFAAIEQYIPVIDELVSEVRARQHEFHNQLLAARSIVETSDSLQEAQSQMAAYTQEVIMRSDVREVLQIDSKVIGGFVYSKMKMAEVLKLTLTSRIHASFAAMATDEHQLIEIIGVLLDNAIEASYPGDEIIITTRRAADSAHTEISVLNPGAARSQEEFGQMFTRGYTTKNAGGGTRGYGLYNVKRIVLQQRGKIITRNTELDGIPYLSIGVLIP